MLWLSISILVVCFCVIISERDFYELLNVQKDADDRTIRRAFKKLAMTDHPDKNKDDPDAHNKFVRINRAYEVLKDSDLRKKYDQFGEKGLKEDHPGHQGFQSWQYFHDNFGIYDEDVEIVTLSRADFDQSVLGSDALWFINFYSPQCSHCHQLAPAWRLLARELFGVIRFGAINCGDDWTLCREQSIHSYPSLKLYPNSVVYSGARDKESMVNYVLEQLDVTILKVTSKNRKALLEEWEPYNSRPWVLDLCEDSAMCLSGQSKRKLAAMLNGLVNVGTVDCSQEEQFCGSLGRNNAVVYFPQGQMDLESANMIDSLDARDIYMAILHLLPDIVQINDQQFKDIAEDNKASWLVKFVNGATENDWEMKKLPALLGDINVGVVNCSKSNVCLQMHINKWPSFVVFKPHGGYEFHHGRQTAEDVAAFARECARTNVHTLGPQNFPISSEDVWFVDYFAPWCPPCMKLLPEFRKASTVLKETVHFGTVDCAAHQQLCVQMNVHSYPTTVLYNNSIPHSFVGLHSMQELVDFVEDVKNPPVIKLDPESLQSLVLDRPEGELWLVDFFANWCGPCQQLAPEWRRLAKMLHDTDNVKVAQIDCAIHQQTCIDNQIRGYPTVRLYPSGKNNFQDYTGWMRNAESLHQWATQFLPSSVQPLDSHSFFEDVLESSEPWLVDFYTSWCGHCQMFAPKLEIVAQRLSSVANVGKVDCDVAPDVCQLAGIRAYPTVFFYPGIKPEEEQAQDPQGVHVQTQEPHQIIELVNNMITQHNTIHVKDEL